MPYFDGSAGRVYFRAWRADAPRSAAVIFLHGFGEQSLLRTLPPAWDELGRDFGRITLPTLLVHGSQDPIVPVSVARDWAARLPGGQLAEFAGARHDVLNETVHRQVAAALIEFVGSVADPVPAVPAGQTA